MSRRGFTLLEAMTVCAIVAILTALAVDSFQSAITQARNNDGVLSVYGQLLAARKVARAHNQPVRLVFLTDAGTPQARWERLPCDNQTFGIGCPAAACSATAGCGTSGCPCGDMGPSIPLAPGVDLSSWNGLCFQGGTGQAVPRAPGSGDCLGPVPPGLLSLRAGVAHQPDQFLQLEPMTGQPRLLVCGAADAGCR